MIGHFNHVPRRFVMAMIDSFVAELDQEGKTTRRVLERVPADKLSWKPHSKSWSLGQLALHVAQAPGLISTWCPHDATEFSCHDGQAEAKSMEEILAAHEDSMTKTKDMLNTLGDVGLMRNWEAKAGGATLFAMPKVAVVRSIVLNHWIHHRGQ